MKSLTVIAGSLVLILSGIGCSESPSSTQTSPPPSSPTLTEKAATSADKTAEAVKESATAVQGTAKTGVDAAKSEASKVADAAEKSIQDILASAKNLAAEGKWTECMAALQQLANVKLSPEQQALVDSLKKQAQENLSKASLDKGAAEATKAAGNLLNK